MFTRRGVMGLFSGLLSLFVTKKVEAVTPNYTLRKGYIELPEWCPSGWVPTMGQTISKDQSPYLFKRVKIIRKDGSTFNYIPLYVGENAVLPGSGIHIPTELEAHGWQDNLTYTGKKKPSTKIVVQLIATEPQLWSNGKVSQAGITTLFQVERDQFEKFYGPIEKPILGGSPYNETLCQSCL